MSSRTFGMRVQRLGLLAIGVVLWSAPATAPAQTLFTWPDTTVNIEAYATLEECQAAISRSMNYTASREDLESGVWTDTIPLDSLEVAGPRPLPTVVVETARRCGARFSNADSVSPAQLRVLLPLYLQAGWDTRARTLVERRLAAIGTKDDAERAAVLDSVFDILLARSGDRIGAPRFALVEELADSWVPRVADRVRRRCPLQCCRPPVRRPFRRPTTPRATSRYDHEPACGSLPGMASCMAHWRIPCATLLASGREFSRVANVCKAG